MRDQLTSADVSALIRRCCTAYARPFATKAAALVDLWLEKLEHLPASAVKAAVEDWIGSEPKFPTIAGLKKAATARTPKTDAERNPIALDYACPQCRTEPRTRVWLIERRSRSDLRPVILVIEHPNGTETEYLLASRDLCRCEWDDKRRRGLTPFQRRLIDEADYPAGIGRRWRPRDDGSLEEVAVPEPQPVEA